MIILYHLYILFMNYILSILIKSHSIDQRADTMAAGASQSPLTTFKDQFAKKLSADFRSS